MMTNEMNSTFLLYHFYIRISYRGVRILSCQGPPHRSAFFMRCVACVTMYRDKFLFSPIFYFGCKKLACLQYDLVLVLWQDTEYLCHRPRYYRNCTYTHREKSATRRIKTHPWWTALKRIFISGKHLVVAGWVRMPPLPQNLAFLFMISK